jgi:phage baseplate assembly protein gpV
MSDIESTVLRLVEKWWADLRTERHGIVTSYDPDTHLGKVMFQPEGQESGWLPIETGHIGDGYGIAIGLQPGDGKEKGDQVVVRYQEGDLESGKIALRVHSDDQKPPKVESGELVIWTRFQKSDGGPESAQGAQGGEGQKLFFKKDGSMEYTDGNGATMTFDGEGNIKFQCKSMQIISEETTTIHAKGDLGLKGDGNAELTSGGVTGVDAGSVVIVKGNGDVSDGSVSPPSGQPSVPPFQVP